MCLTAQSRSGMKWSNCYTFLGAWWEASLITNHSICSSIGSTLLTSHWLSKAPSMSSFKTMRSCIRCWRYFASWSTIGSIESGSIHGISMDSWCSRKLLSTWHRCWQCGTVSNQDQNITSKSGSTSRKSHSFTSKWFLETTLTSLSASTTMIVRLPNCQARLSLWLLT